MLRTDIECSICTAFQSRAATKVLVEDPCRRRVHSYFGKAYAHGLCLGAPNLFDVRGLIPKSTFPSLVCMAVRFGCCTCSLIGFESHHVGYLDPSVPISNQVKNDNRHTSPYVYVPLVFAVCFNIKHPPTPNQEYSIYESLYIGDHVKYHGLAERLRKGLAGF